MLVDDGGLRVHCIDGVDLPPTVRSAGLEETTAAAKAMVRSLGSMCCAILLMGV
jgi:hypothetical protein